MSILEITHLQGSRTGQMSCSAAGHLGVIKKVVADKQSSGWVLLKLFKDDGVAEAWCVNTDKGRAGER